MTDQTHDATGGYILIDPPVGPYSPEEDILAWLKELKSLPDKPEVRAAIAEANKYLEVQRK